MSCEEVYKPQVYIGHDNSVVIIPYTDLPARINWDMSETTEVQVSADLTSSTTTGDDVTASSNDVPNVVWYADTGTEWQIYMKVGMFVGITAGEYKLRVIIIDLTNTNGVVVADDLIVDVVGVP